MGGWWQDNFPPESLPPATLTIMKYIFVADLIFIFIGIAVFRESVTSQSAIIRITGMVIGALFIRLGPIIQAAYKEKQLCLSTSTKSRKK
jgi:hypothetical protein